MPMLILWNGSNATMTSRRVVDIPRIEGGICGDMGWKLLKGDNGLLIQRTEIGDIAFIEWLGIFGQDHIAIVRGGGSGDAGAISPNEFFFLFDGSIGLLLVGGAFDAQFAVRIADRDLCFVVAIFDIRTFVIFLDPSINVFSVKGHDLTEARNLFFEIAHGGMQKPLEQGGIKVAQFLGEPIAAGKGLLGIKAIGSRWIQMQRKAHFEDEQRMVQQKRAKLCGIDHLFADANEKSLQIGSDRMAMRATIGRLLFLPLLNDRPIKESEKSAVILDDRIIFKECSKRRLVKDRRRGYDHERNSFAKRIGFGNPYFA